MGGAFSVPAVAAEAVLPDAEAAFEPTLPAIMPGQC